MKEYKVQVVKYDYRTSDGKEFEDIINSIASEGWELKKTFWIDYAYGAKNPLVLIFERDKK
ncbi:DUF4177 domain-containing protein [Bacteroidota bacterium]